MRRHRHEVTMPGPHFCITVYPGNVFAHVHGLDAAHWLVAFARRPAEEIGEVVAVDDGEHEGELRFESSVFRTLIEAINRTTFRCLLFIDDEVPTPGWLDVMAAQPVAEPPAVRGREN